MNSSRARFNYIKKVVTEVIYLLLYIFIKIRSHPRGSNIWISQFTPVRLNTAQPPPPFFRTRSHPRGSNIWIFDRLTSFDHDPGVIAQIWHRNRIPRTRFTIYTRKRDSPISKTDFANFPALFSRRWPLDIFYFEN